MEWPEHFPDSCPPSEAVMTTGEVYRLTNKETPRSDDFRSYREMYPERTFQVPECQVCGISIHTLLEDVDRLRRRVPGAKKKFVSKGTLTPIYGKMLNTPSNETSHHTWWVQHDEQPWHVFVNILPPERP